MRTSEVIVSSGNEHLALITAIPFLVLGSVKGTNWLGVRSEMAARLRFSPDGSIHKSVSTPMLANTDPRARQEHQ